MPGAGLWEGGWEMTSCVYVVCSALCYVMSVMIYFFVEDPLENEKVLLKGLS